MKTSKLKFDNKAFLYDKEDVNHYDEIDTD